MIQGCAKSFCISCFLVRNIAKGDKHFLNEDRFIFLAKRSKVYFI